ncbi:MAG: penicillin-binding protein 2 [Chloroflexi bacterium]|nr:penicillin-binding protein 2 [Chloroflexota bacterium]
MTDAPRRRLRFLGTLLIGLLFVIVVQLFQVQVVNHKTYADQGRKNRTQVIRLPDPPRGVIRDRNGTVLAGNGVTYSIEASPSVLTGTIRSTAVMSLSELLHVPAARVEQILERNPAWVVVERSVSRELAEQAVALGIWGVDVRSSWVRDYPQGSLGSHLLGFCNLERGFYGVEGFYNEELRPEIVTETMVVDSYREQVPWAAVPVTLPHRGSDLVLSVDLTVQAIVEAELAYSLAEYEADSGTIIVMDPRTFEVLAMASSPNYDPGRYPAYYSQSPLPFSDPAVSQQYEPGSVFKILTVAAALDAGIATPDTTYTDQGWIEVGGQVIQNATREAYGEQTVTDLLVKSLNVGSAWLSTQMAPDTFYRYVQAFGIGRPTGIDVAGEVGGQLWLPGDLEHYHDSNLGTNSFGQGLAVTPIQMAVAAATVANDGVRLRPRVVSQVIAADGTVSLSQSVMEAQPISSETARIVTNMMVRVIEDGVPQARVPGYRFAGKTGTAQVYVPGGYDRDATIASFVGFGPVPDPRMVILVKLDNPKTSPWGSQTAARSFQRLATRLCVVLNIPPSLTEADQ